MGDFLHFALHCELVAEFGYVLSGAKRRNRIVQLLNQEAVAASDLFLVHVGGLGNLVKRSRKPTLPTRQVEGSGGDALDTASADKPFLDGFAVNNGGGFQDVFGQVEVVGNLCDFGKGKGEVAFGGVANADAALPFAQAVNLRLLARAEAFAVDVPVMPVDGCG